jgi:plasmid stability protein
MCQMCDEIEADLRRMGITMDEKITVDFDHAMIEELERRARAHGHEVADEVREIVRETVARPPSRDREALIERSRALRASLGPQTTDSLTLLLEDRNR